jgi:hypothetical protein
MKTKSLFFIFCVASTLFFNEAIGQVGINTDGSAPDASAGLDVYYTNNGFLLPRMTASQRTGISPAANGLLVYQTDETAGFYYYNETAWIFLGSGDGYSGNVIDTDGNVYPTVRIGNQEWMAENLRVTHYRNGDFIPNVTDNTAWSGLTAGEAAFCTSPS